MRTGTRRRVLCGYGMGSLALCSAYMLHSRWNTAPLPPARSAFFEGRVVGTSEECPDCPASDQTVWPSLFTSAEQFLEHGRLWDSRIAQRLEKALRDCFLIGCSQEVWAAAYSESPRQGMADVDLVGWHFAVAHTWSADECSRLCEAKFPCTSWTWTEQNRTCRLHRQPLSELGARELNGRHSGYVGRFGTETLPLLSAARKRGLKVPGARRASCRPLVKWANYTIQLGAEIATLKRGLLFSDIGCCELCAATIGCVAWQLWGNQCVLKASIQALRPAVPADRLRGAGVMLSLPGAPLPDQVNPLLRKVRWEDVRVLFSPEPSGVVIKQAPRRLRRRGWVRCPNQLDISFIIATRNEPCAYPEINSLCPHNRLRNSMESLLFFDWATYNVTCEIIIVTWNELAGMPRMQQVLELPLKRSCAVRFIAFSAQTHRERLGSEVPFHEMQAKNAGMRRTAGRWVVIGNIDVLWPARLLRSIAQDVKTFRRDTRITLLAQRYNLDRWGGLQRWISADTPQGLRMDIGGKCSRSTGPPPFGYNYTTGDIRDWTQALFCDGCSGDFTMIPCEAAERSRGYPETAHQVFHDQELLCWLEFGNYTVIGKSYPRRSYATAMDDYVHAAFPGTPPGCAVFHQHHDRAVDPGALVGWRKREFIAGTRKLYAATGKARARWRMCWSRQSKAWWRRRTNGNYNATARPDCWGACADPAKEEIWPPTLSDAYQQWTASVKAKSFRQLERGQARKLKRLFRHNVA
eukprot:TRINITY_DN55968_c0_g1_i1.p1 TRINITY_DN55968_c0_g1~~TRINITY_DN55968_c0_g1_i1.p1  ORF type:complete len:780 (+),score=78.42 TRINITY_DN55968_c0_g1_i1:95-2341(+)